MTKKKSPTQAQMIQLIDLKLNEKNPRQINKSQFYQLVDSIRDFPEMMRINQIVVDENKKILSGNQRYLALKELGYKEIPEAWVKVEHQFSEDQKARAVVKMNQHSGEWDYDIMFNIYPPDMLKQLGIQIDKESQLEKEFDRTKNDDAEMPIVPKYDEQYNAIIVLCKSTTELIAMRERFGLKTMKSYKKPQHGITHVVEASRIL